MSKMIKVEDNGTEWVLECNVCGYVELYKQGDTIHTQAGDVCPACIDNIDDGGSIDLINVSGDCTCVTCRDNKTCQFAFNNYNTQGDCLAIK
jgi:hypothetical protein